MNPLEFLRGMMDDEDDSDRAIEKSFPMRDMWRPLHKNMKDLRKAANIAEQRAMRAKQMFWATIESDIGHDDQDMRYNEKNDEIEILKSRKH